MEVEDDLPSLSLFLYLFLGTAHSSTGGKISMAKCKGGGEEGRGSGRWRKRLVEESEGAVSGQTRMKV